MNILKKAILKIAVSFGLISCLGAVANAKFVTVEVTSKYENSKESAVAKALHSFAVHNKICKKNNLGEDILEMLSSDFVGSNENLVFFEKEYLDISDKKVEKIRKALKDYKKHSVNMTEEDIKSAKEKSIEMMQKKLTKLENFVRDFEKAKEEKDKVQSIKNYYNEGIKEIKARKNDDVEIDELSREGIELTQQIIKDEDKIKKELIPMFEDMVENCKEKFIPNLKSKINLVKRFDVSSIDLKGLNKGFVLNERLISRKDIASVVE